MDLLISRSAWMSESVNPVTAKDGGNAVFAGRLQEVGGRAASGTKAEQKTAEGSTFFRMLLNKKTQHAAHAGVFCLMATRKGSNSAHRAPHPYGAPSEFKIAPGDFVNPLLRVQHSFRVLLNKKTPARCACWGFLFNGDPEGT